MTDVTTVEMPFNELFSKMIESYNSHLDNADMRANYANGIETAEGKKYIKVSIALGSQRSVWGFVVNVHNDKKFKYGDILMAASWSAPARNFARGNIFEIEKMNVRWTGA